MKHKPWGQLIIIDLHGCNKDLLRNPEKIKIFSKELCKRIDIKTFGEPIIKRFGEGILEGYSLMQFVETSSITIHMDEFENRVFIDVFSCRNFNSRIAAYYAKQYFEAKRIRYRTVYRG